MIDLDPMTACSGWMGGSSKTVTPHCHWHSLKGSSSSIRIIRCSELSGTKGITSSVRKNVQHT